MDNQYGNMQGMPQPGMPQPGMPQPGMPQPGMPQPGMGGTCAFKERNVVTAVIFSILTCGIYGIYWFIKMTDESNVYATEKSATGGMAFLYSLLTCGIYSLYWNYKMGKKLQESGAARGVKINDQSALYLILAVLGQGWICQILMQLDLNKIANA